MFWVRLCNPQRQGCCRHGLHDLWHGQHLEFLCQHTSKDDLCHAQEGCASQAPAPILLSTCVMTRWVRASPNRRRSLAQCPAVWRGGVGRGLAGGGGGWASQPLALACTGVVSVCSCRPANMAGTHGCCKLSLSVIFLHILFVPLLPGRELLKVLMAAVDWRSCGSHVLTSASCLRMLWCCDLICKLCRLGSCHRGVCVCVCVWVWVWVWVCVGVRVCGCVWGCVCVCVCMCVCVCVMLCCQDAPASVMYSCHTAPDPVFASARSSAASQLLPCMYD